MQIVDYIAQVTGKTVAQLFSSGSPLVRLKQDGAVISVSYWDASLTAAAPTSAQLAAALAAPAAQSELIEYANAKQDATMRGGITVNVAASGSPVNVAAATDTASLVLLQGAVSIASVNSGATFNWVQPAGPITLTAAEILTLFAAVTAFIQATFTTLASMVTAIRGGSITTAAQIDAAAWPANS